MAQTNYSGPVSSEGGYLVQPLGSNAFYIDVDPADGYLKIGGGASVGSNVGLIIQPDGTVNVTADVDVSDIDLADGSAAAPSLSFQSDDDTGLYYSGGSVRAASSGAEVWQWGDDVVQMSNTTILSVNDGDVSNPGIAFRLDPDTGIYRQGANNLRIGVAGAGVMAAEAGNLRALADLQVANDLNLSSGSVVTFPEASADNWTIENVTGEGLTFTDVTGIDAYPVFRKGTTDSSADLQLWVEGLRDGANFRGVSIGYGGDRNNLRSLGSGSGNDIPLDVIWQSTVMLTMEDSSAVELAVGTMRGNDDSEADSNPAQSITIRGGNKTAGLGDGGDLNLEGGTSAGGNAGSVVISTAGLSALEASATQNILVSNGNLVLNRASTVTGLVQHGQTDAIVALTGSNSLSQGGNILMYGNTHASTPNRVVLRQGASNMIDIQGSQLLGFYGASPVAQASFIDALTDSTGGAVDGTLAAISGSGADTDINNNFADLAAKVNALELVVRNLGLTAAS